MTLWRTDWTAKFSPAERSLVDLIHAESIWIYELGEVLPNLERLEASPKATPARMNGSGRKHLLEMPRARQLRARSA